MAIEGELIVAYTEEEGGPWISTEASPMLWRKVPSDSYLAGKWFKGKRVAQIGYFILHSFRTNENRRWDCTNGWTGKYDRTLT